jgi:hypothetical protein
VASFRNSSHQLIVSLLDNDACVFIVRVFLLSQGRFEQVVARPEDHIVVNSELVIYIDPCPVGTSFALPAPIVENPVLRGIIFEAYSYRVTLKGLTCISTLTGQFRLF